MNPRTLVSRVPFVVLVIVALGVGLGVTLWLSTDAAERSYQLGHARQVNEALMQQKEGLERDVLEAQAAPALAEAARKLGMIPSRDTAHLVQDAAGNWIVVGTPKPAEGLPPPPLNAPLPDPAPARAARSACRGTARGPCPTPAAPGSAGVPGRPRFPWSPLPARSRTPTSGELPVPGPVPLSQPVPLSPLPVLRRRRSSCPPHHWTPSPAHLPPGAAAQPGAPVGTEPGAPA